MAADGSVVIEVTLDDGTVVSGLSNINNQLDDTASQGEQSFGKISSGIGKFGVAAAATFAAVGAGALLIGGGAIKSALNVEEASNRIQASLGTTAEETEALTDVARGIYNKGFGESLGEVSDALVKVRQNIATLDDSELEQVTGNAIALANTFDSDVNEVTRAANNLIVNFGLESEKAFDLLTQGAQNGLNFSGELFDNIAEYAPLLADFGYTAEEAFGLLGRGADAGVYNLDYINDVLKEFQIRATDGSKSTAAAFAELGPAVQAVEKQFRSGEATVADISAAAVSELAKIDDRVKQNELGVALFGTKWEDLGGDVVLSIFESQQAVSGFEGAISDLVAVQEQSFGQRFQSLLRSTMDALTPLGVVLLDIAERVFPIIQSAIQGFSTAIQSIAPIVGAFVEGLIANIQPRFESLVEFFTNNGTSILGTITNAYNSIKNVIETIINTIAPFIQSTLAVITQFWNENGTQILEAVTNAFNAVKAVIDFVMPAILLVISVVWDAIKNVISGALNIILGLVKVFTGVFNGDFSKLWEGVKQLFSGAVDFILGLMTLTFFGGLRTLFTNLARTILNSVRTNWTAIVNTYRTFSGNVIGTIGNLVTSVVNFFRALATGAQSQIYSMVSNVLSRITTLANGMINAIRGLPARFTQFGRDIIQGLINGIKALGANAIAAVGDVANKIIDKVTGIFDINSPSRVMRSLGGFISEGLEVGIETKGKSLIDTTAKLGESIKDTFSNSLGGTLDASLTSSFNGAIPNPLRGNNLNLGMNNSSSAVSSAATTKANSNISNNKTSVNIEPAPILLDGKKIADVTFKQTSNNIYNATSVNGLMKGVKI